MILVAVYWQESEHYQGCDGMSKYTTEIRWIIEQTTNDSPNPVPRGAQYPKAVYEKLGLADFPIYDESYRYTLSDKIINHYYVREIGFETVALFAWYMKQKMWEIMPYYNKLYLALETINDPLEEFRKERNEDWVVNTEDDVNNTSTTTTQANSQTNSKNIYQDTPMSLLNNGDGTPTVEGLDYATNVTYDDDTASSNSDNNTHATRKGTKDEDGQRNIIEKGHNSSQAKLFEEYAKAQINIDVRIIDDLGELFMPLW